MKFSRQRSFAASCTCRSSHFAESLILSFKSILEQCHLELPYKKVLQTYNKVRKQQKFSASYTVFNSILILSYGNCGILPVK